MANRITTVFDAETKGFKAGIKDVQRSIKEADGALGKMRAGIKSSAGQFKASNAQQAAAVAGIGAAAFKAVGFASDLEESVNAVQVTFGDAADAILKIGDDSAVSFGMSKAEFNSMAVSFAAFAKQVAGPGGDVAGTINDLSTRVADFASVMNLDLATATQVFQSSLAGQTEPIRKYGKDLSAAAVEQYALTNKLVESKSELTETIKVQARYGLLMEQTSDVAGDFANTSDSLANSQRILRAEAIDLAADIGEDLAPAMEQLVVGMRSLVTVVETLHLDDVLSVMNKFDDAGTWFGRGMRRAIDDTADRNWALVDALAASEKAAHEFDMELLDGIDTYEDVRAKVLELTDSEHAANVVGLEWLKTQQELTGASEATADAVEQAARGQAHGQRQMREYVRGLHEQGRANRQVEVEVEDLTEATEEYRQSVIDLVDEINNNTSSMFDYETATINLSESVAGLADLTGNELRLAQINAAEDALTVAEAFADEKYAGDDAALSATYQRTELQRLQEKYPELYAEIQRYIDELARIPRNINTRLSISGGNTTGTRVTIGGDPIRNVRALPGQAAPVGADGAIVNRPTWSLIGEAGPEAVVPLNKTNGNQPLPGNLGIGGVQVHIHGNVYGEQAIREAINDAAGKALMTLRAGRR